MNGKSKSTGKASSRRREQRLPDGTVVVSGRPGRLLSDFANMDATPAIPDDDIPEITRDVLDRGWLTHGNVVIRGPRKPGRPLGSGKKTLIAIRLDTDVVEALRAKGRGWQTYLNGLVREAVMGKRKRKRAS